MFLYCGPILAPGFIIWTNSNTTYGYLRIINNESWSCCSWEDFQRFSLYIPMKKKKRCLTAMIPSTLRGQDLNKLEYALAEDHCALIWLSIALLFFRKRFLEISLLQYHENLLFPKLWPHLNNYKSPLTTEIFIYMYVLSGPLVL